MRKIIGRPADCLKPLIEIHSHLPLSRDIAVGDGFMGVSPKLGSNSRLPAVFDDFRADFPDLYTPESQAARGRRALRYDAVYMVKQLYLEYYGFKKAIRTDFELWNSLPGIVNCMGLVRDHAYTGGIFGCDRNMETGAASWEGHSYCRCKWICAICMATAENRYRDEIAQALRAAQEMGLLAVMNTLTIPHTADMGCGESLGLLRLGANALREDWSFKKFKARYEFKGSIVSLEQMFGSNGFHPHFHEIYFIRGGSDMEAFGAEYAKHWERICRKKGIIPRGKIRAFREHGYSVGFANAEYLAKFDSDKYIKKLSAEIAFSSVKKGSVENGGIHPLELAAFAYAGGEFDREALEHFMDYTTTMKGVARVRWSKGLKDFFGIVDFQESEKERRSAVEKEVIFRVDADGMKRIAIEKALGEVQNVAEVEGRSGVVEWFEDFDEKLLDV